MEWEKFLYHSFKNILKKVSTEKKINASEEVVDYISNIMVFYCKNIPYYLIDVIEKDPFKRYKTKGDVSLLLVGLFTEWVNRKNRPLTEKDYILAGKINYYNAYVYLDENFGKYFKEEKSKLNISEFFKRKPTFLSYLELFKEISQNFEKYAFLLKEYKTETKNIQMMYEIFPNLKRLEIF